MEILKYVARSQVFIFSADLVFLRYLTRWVSDKRHGQLFRQWSVHVATFFVVGSNGLLDSCVWVGFSDVYLHVWLKRNLDRFLSPNDSNFF